MSLFKFLRKNYYIIFLIVALVMLIGLLYLKYGMGQSGQEQNVVSLKNYNDPDDHFNLSVPEDWTVHSGYGRARTGIGTEHETATRTEITNMFFERKGLNISIYEKAENCKNIIKSNTTLAGLPAYFDSKHYSWTVYTKDAVILVSYYYPGAGVYHKRNGDALAANSSQMFSDQKAINDIVATLKFKSAEALECP